jgi:TonB family protein
VSAATLIFGPDGSAPRQTLALSLSLLLHLTLAFAILLSIRHEVPPAPLEITIFEGPSGPASPPPGEKGALPGPARELSGEARPLAEKKPATASRTKAVARPHRTQKRRAGARPSEERPPPVASTSSPLPPSMHATESARPSVAKREEAAQTGAPGTARSEKDDELGSSAAAALQPEGGLASDISLRLPGPGGDGSGWSSGSGERGAGGGGTGSGGFSVSGAGAGGAGRTHASIWEWTQRYLAGLRSAYNEEFLYDATLRGVIVVRYEILGSGAVGQVTLVSSQLRDPRFERALLNQIRRWRYPPEPTGTVIVTWPFSFRPPA